MDKSIAHQHVYFLILARFILLIGCTVTLLIQQGRMFDLQYLLSIPSGKLLAFTFFLNLAYLFLTRFLKKFLKIFMIFQMLTDLFMETFLIYLTGGVLSVFISLYFASILSAGILIGPNSSFVFASLSTIGISVIALFYFIAAINHTPLPFIKEHSYYSFLESDFPFIKAYLFAQGMAFHLVAFFIHRFSYFIHRQKILHEEILENLTDGVIVVDAKQKLVFLNKQAKILLELSTEESFAEKHIGEILSKTKHEGIYNAFIGQKSLRMKTELKLEKGILPIQVSIAPFSTKKKIQSYIIVLRDISDQKRMEDAVKRANRLETISEMTSAIAHEIRNPLASIRGSIQELKNTLDESDSRYILMDIAIRESDRINGIVTDFLTFSGIRTASLQKISLTHLLEEFLFFLKKRKEMETAIIEKEIMENLIIQGDSEQLKQVFYNLAINAMEASLEKLELKVTAKHCNLLDFSKTIYNDFEGNEQKGIEVCFIDKGKGLTKEHFRKLFTPFFTTKRNGTGMGLAMVSKILDMHDALYRVQSEIGQGTIFSIWFPLKTDKK
ncbi:MAG: PAS domain-containing protein [Candidatus Brocadiae bacterium]|nr:PAS domain-containing protein [Candidatus Brocadiia bacterium]